MKPLIGVLPLFEKDSHNYWIKPVYMHGVETAGGLPVLLNLTDHPDSWRAMCDRMDGFLFTGGQDVGPALYHQEKIPECCYQAEERDAQEMWMLQTLLEMDKPILGICRGCQMLNVAMGGTLYQDLPTQHPSEINHSQSKLQIPRDEVSHAVTLSPGSLLHRLMDSDTPAVNSLHHQAIWEVAPALFPSAVAPDGIVEAVESTAHRFVLGVQWHPEFLWHKRPDMLAIFQGLVDSCK